MKAISIRQPWAWAIIHAGKRIENRDWPTSYRGPILIHAGKGMSVREYDDAVDFFIRRAGVDRRIIPDRHHFYRGGIVGMAYLIDCVERSNDPWFMGHYGFVLGDVEELPFHESKGALGLFNAEHPDVDLV